ncbi:hypothetical protein D3C75_1003970 [compost metagenome]
MLQHQKPYGSAGQKDDMVRLDEGAGPLGNGVVMGINLLNIPHCPVGGRLEPHLLQRDSPAVGPLQQPLLLQNPQIPSGRIH